MEAKTLMVDMDNVITDGRFFDYIEDFLGISYDDSSEHDYSSLTQDKDKYLEFWNWVKDKNFYEDSPLLDGCYDVLRELYDVYDVYIVTAYLWDESIDVSGYNLMNKYYYLKKMLPFIDPSRFIFTSNKDMLHFDIKIDDKEENLTNTDVRILFSRWHNRNVPDSDVIRVNGWEDIRSVLL